VPLFIGYLIICAVTRLVVYYQIFNISIVPFLDFSEILTSFLDVIVITQRTVLASGVGILIVMYVIFKFYIKGKKKKVWMNRVIYEEVLSLKFLIYPIAVIPINLFAASIRYDINQADFWITAFRNSAGFFLFVLLLRPFFFFFGKNFLVKRFFKSILWLSLFFYIYTVLNGYIEALIVFDSDKRKEVTIVTAEGKKISTDTLNVYIGNTSKYLFLYNTNTHSTSVYPLNEIKQYVFSGKRTND
jgi:hypothetical protein